MGIIRWRYFLESCLIITVILFIIQLNSNKLYEFSDNILERAVDLLDFSKWSYAMRVFVNTACLLLLCVVRFRVEIMNSLRSSFEKWSARDRIADTNISSEVEEDEDYRNRVKRDKEWRDRAANRLPYK